MATLKWRGDAPAVAQVDSYTVGGTVEADDVFKHVVSNKTLSVTAGSTNTTTVATTIAAAWNALSSTAYPEFAEATAAGNGAAVTFTADTAGKPFTCAYSTTEANGGAADDQTYSGSTTTANAGPNVWSTAANWTGGSAPANNDTVWIENSTVSLLYGLAQSSITLTALNIPNSFTGTVGLPERNGGGYYEYRDGYLAISATTVNIGDGPGTGSGRIKLDTGSNATTVNVYGSGSPLERGRKAVLLKGTHASNVLNVTQGSVGVCTLAGETGQFATVRVGYETQQDSDADVELGAGLTLATLTMSGGKVSLANGGTTVTQEGGTLTIEGGAITTLTIRGGTCIVKGAGTITTAKVSGSGVLDFSQDLRAKTVTNPVELYGDQCRFVDPHQVVGSLVLDLNEGATLANLDLGRNVRLTRGTPA